MLLQLQRTHLQKVCSLSVLPYGYILLPSGWGTSCHGPRREFSMHDGVPEGNAYMKQR